MKKLDRGAIAQLVAHLNGIEGASGSNPLSSIFRETATIDTTDGLQTLVGSAIALGMWRHRQDACATATHINPPLCRIDITPTGGLIQVVCQTCL